MSWSLDWFAAEALAKTGSQIRRAGWTDRVLSRQGAVWLLIIAGVAAVVKATDITAAELQARDWTDQPSNANPCAATPAFNSAAPVYRQWTDQPLFLPPPPPGFPS